MRTKSAITILTATSLLTGCGSIDYETKDLSAVDITVTVAEQELGTTTDTTDTLLFTTVSTSTHLVKTTDTTTTTTRHTTTELVKQEQTEPKPAATEQEPVVIEPSVEPETEPPVQEVDKQTEPPVAGTPGVLIYSGMRGTYYAPGSWNGYSAIGGSGRSLLDCNGGGDGYAKGSIASRYLYNLLGYYSNGGRTAVWLSVAGYPDMEGIYYLDDCSGANVIDFFYNANGNCQFCYAGVVSVDIYYVN